MKAFVTGSTGFLGIHLCQELAKDGWEIFAFHRPTSDLSELKKIAGISYVVGDVRDKKSLQNAMPDKVDAVFHAAGSVGFLDPRLEKDQYDINELGARNVVDVAVRKNARRFIYTSTVLTYDWSDGKRITEQSPPNRSSRYAYIHSKCLAEREVEQGTERGLDVVVIHPTAIFGAYDKATWSKMFREIERGLRVPASPPGGATICHMRKVAQAHVRAFHMGRRGEHYVLGGVDSTFMEIAQAIARILGRPAPRFILPAPLFKLAGRLEYGISSRLGKEPMVYPSMADMLCETILCDSTKAIHELGYDPSSLDTMLMDCYQWMVAEGMLPQRKAA